jgi:predicted nucleotidyltransferase
MGPEWFVTHACRALPEQVRSIVLFGSAAAGDFIEGTSSYDVLVVVDRMGVAELDALAPTIREWRKAGNPLPLLFTAEQLANTTDAFAIEFLEMQHARRILYGEDPIAGLTIDATHVRIHLERELKGKSLALRDRYVLAAGDRRLIAELLTDSLSSFLSLFRTALRLYEPQAPAGKVDALRALTRHISFDPQPFLTVEELKEGRRGVRGIDMPALFGRYFGAVETVTDAVDRLIHSPA